MLHEETKANKSFHGTNLAKISEIWDEEMDNEVVISNPIDKAIIKSFDRADKGILERKTIIKLAKQETNEKEPNIAKRIEKMSKKEYLIRVARGLYRLDTEVEFELAGERLPSGEIPTEIRREHTSDLKDAIKVWKGCVPKPTCEYDLGEVLEAIKTSENHPLFPDLRNHLPDICTKWKDYKDELIELGGMKSALLEAIKCEILKCFFGLDLRFVFPEDYDYEYELRDFESAPLHDYVYDNILALAQSGDQDQWAGYYEYQKTLDRFRHDPIIDKGGSALWGDPVVHVRVPKDLRTILAGGVNRFRSFFEDVEKSELMNMGNDITKKIETLQHKRDNLIMELDMLLYHSSFPGDCKYLK